MLREIPGLRVFSKLEYDFRFSRKCYGGFRGVFDTFDQALLSAPKTKKQGFDIPEFAEEFHDRLIQIFSYDYPILFWLKSILKEGTTIFDLGGHIGIHFYAYEKYLCYPDEFKWVVCDLPEIIKKGREIAKQKNRSELSFTEKIEDAKNADVLIAAGAIQYIESPAFAEALASLSKRPDHILLNKLPLYDGDQFVTLQNGGVAFTPQYVFNQKKFIDSIRSLGYEIADTWSNSELDCQIPFFPDYSVQRYSGLYFKLKYVEHIF